MRNFAPRPWDDYKGTLIPQVAENMSPTNVYKEEKEKDLALWNFLWLSFPELDEFLENKNHLLPENFFIPVGKHLAVLGRAPDLIPAMEHGPVHFVNCLKNHEEYSTFHPAKLRGNEWVDTMMSRARLSERLAGNVITINFKSTSTDVSKEDNCSSEECNPAVEEDDSAKETDLQSGIRNFANNGSGTFTDTLVSAKPIVRAVIDFIRQQPEFFAAEIAELRGFLGEPFVTSRMVLVEVDTPSLPEPQTLAQIIAWLATLEMVALSDLRTRLLPLDLLPGAVIDDLNERALDLTGDLALEENGEKFIIVREVLERVVAAW